jgi:hypothetical protein
MRNLEEIGLGKMAILDRSDFFFKALPTDVQQDSLSNFGISIEEYKDIFNSVDSALTNRQRLRAETIIQMNILKNMPLLKRNNYREVWAETKKIEKVKKNS